MKDKSSWTTARPLGMKEPQDEGSSIGTYTYDIVSLYTRGHTWGVVECPDRNEPTTSKVDKCVRLPYQDPTRAIYTDTVHKHGLSKLVSPTVDQSTTMVIFTRMLT